MRFDDACRRLAELPARLPPPPPRIRPVLLPGPDGRLATMPDLPPQRDAAVLLLIQPDAAGQATVLLTERAPGGHRHAGQISLPGGAIEDGEGVVEAALREAREEVGLDPARAGLVITGTVAPVEVRASGFRVHPVVATSRRPTLLVPDAHEVAAIVHAALDAFLPAAPIEMVTSEVDGRHLRYGAYRIGERLVWGATARILGGLGSWLARAT